MRGRGLAMMATALTAAGLALSAPARAAHDADDHSPNARLAASLKLGGLGDLAFSGDLAVASQFVFDDGATHGFSVIDVSDPAAPRELRRFACPGAGWDVSMWGDLVFLSTDQYTPSLEGTCGSAPGTGFQGIKIVSLDDPLNPVSVGAVAMPCSGSHNNTVLPDPARNRVLLYAASSDFADRYPGEGCDAIVSVPLDAPQNAEVIKAMPSDELEACHDFAVHVQRKLLAGGCNSELRLFDISDPESPRLLSTFTNPLEAFQHSVGFSEDGSVLISGEETAQSTEGGCTGGTPSPHGAIWFHDIENPAIPVLRGYHQVGQGFEAPNFAAPGCSVHNFAIVPTKGDRDVLTAGWYSGGMSVVDFTDPAAAVEVAHYLPDQRDPATRAHYWAAYWYRGHVYATNTFETERKALDVFRVEDPAIGETFRLAHLNPQTVESFADAPAGAQPGASAGPSPSSPPGGQSGTPPSSCRPSPARLRIRGARRILRADLLRGGRRVRHLRVRGREVRLNLRGVSPGAYRVRVRYRGRGTRVRTVSRRVTVC